MFSAIGAIGWIPITIVAYAFHAVAVILDKFLLTERIQHPSAYAFWVGVFGLGALFLIPFDFFIPSSLVIANAFVSGTAFTFALFFFYIAIRAGEASRVAPVVGALSPLFVLLLSRGILAEVLFGKEFFAFAVLVLGSALVSVRHFRVNGAMIRADMKVLGWAALASFLFAVTYVYEKAVFNETTFVNGFIWMRMGGFFGALPFLVFSGSRELIFELPRRVDRVTVGTFFLNKCAGAAGFFLISFAIFLSPSVSLVNAMRGVEYALVFLAALFLSWMRPSIISEEISPGIIFEKILAILLIAGGLALLAFG